MSLGDAETRSYGSTTISPNLQGFSVASLFLRATGDGDVDSLVTTRVFKFTVEFKNNRYHLVYLGGKKKKLTAYKGLCGIISSLKPMPSYFDRLMSNHSAMSSLLQVIGLNNIQLQRRQHYLQ